WSKTRNRIVTPTVTPTCSEIPIFADGRREDAFRPTQESNWRLSAARSSLPSHGRGHWFDPSTAHHKSSIYAPSRQKVREKYGIASAKCAWLCVDETGSSWTERI